MEHPITPPPELVQRLRKEAPHGIRDAGVTRELCLIAAAYRAGADQELEACCEWLDKRQLAASPEYFAKDLLLARRPKPPSLKEQALEALNQMDEPLGVVTARRASIIRRALEQLND